MIQIHHIFWVSTATLGGIDQPGMLQGHAPGKFQAYVEVELKQLKEHLSISDRPDLKRLIKQGRNLLGTNSDGSIPLSYAGMGAHFQCEP